jgi:hypothetical protein
MNNRILLYNFIQILYAVSMLTSACTKEPSYSEIPQIVKASTRVYKYMSTPAGRGLQDSVLLILDIRDGDGNLGINSPLSSEDINRFLSNGDWTNYKVTTFRFINNKFEKIESPVSRDVLFFPALTSSNSIGAKEGILYLNKIFVYVKNYVMYPTKFQIQIRDNNLNESNIAETDTVTVPYPK